MDTAAGLRRAGPAAGGAPWTERGAQVADVYISINLSAGISSLIFPVG